MTEPAATPPLLTWRPMAAWTAGILLVLGLAWFVGAVIVPVLRIPSECRRIRSAGFDQQFMRLPAEAGEESIRRLGGPGRAGLALRIHLWVHGNSADDVVVFLMGFCGKQTASALAGQLDDRSLIRFNVVLYALGQLGPEAAEAVPALVESFKTREGLERCYVAETLANIGPAAAEAVPVLTNALNDDDSGVRHLCACALGEIAVDSQEVILKLEAVASTDSSSEVRSAAAEALKQIRAEEPGN